MKTSCSLLAAPFHQNKNKGREKNKPKIFFTTNFHSLLSLVRTGKAQTKTKLNQNSRSITTAVKANSQKWDFSFLGICILIYSVFAWAYTGFPQLFCLTEQGMCSGREWGSLSEGCCHLVDPSCISGRSCKMCYKESRCYQKTFFN